MSQQLHQERAEYHDSVAKRKVRARLRADGRHRRQTVPRLSALVSGEDLRPGGSGRPAGPAGVSGVRAAGQRADARPADAAEGEGEAVGAGEEVPQPERGEELPQVPLRHERGECVRSVDAFAPGWCELFLAVP